VRPQGTSNVDITWSTADIIKRVKKWQVLDEESMSDHKYIVFEIAADRSVSVQVKKKRKAWSYSKFDPELFREVLAWECAQVNVEREYDQLPEKEKICEVMDNIMERACDATMPRLSGKAKRRESTYWWNNEIDRKRKECNSIRRKWKRKRKRESEAMREEEYRRVKKELRIMIRKAKESA